MKSLIAILLLTNCLAFFMFSHVQKRSQLDADQVQNNLDLQLVSPQPIVLLSEMSTEQLKALNMPDGKSTELMDGLPISDELPVADDTPFDIDL